MPLKSSSPSFREGATFATIGAFVVDLWNNQSIARWFFVQNGIYFFLGLVWGFFGSAFGLGSDFGFGSSTGLGFGSGFGFSAGGLEKVKFFSKKQKNRIVSGNKTHFFLSGLGGTTAVIFFFGLNKILCEIATNYRTHL